MVSSPAPHDPPPPPRRPPAPPGPARARRPLDRHGRGDRGGARARSRSRRRSGSPASCAASARTSSSSPWPPRRPARRTGARRPSPRRTSLRVLTIFWRHNVVGIAPSLTAAATVAGPAGSSARSSPASGSSGGSRAPTAASRSPRGSAPLFPFWRVDGRWPSAGEDGAAVVGRAVAARLGLARGARVDARRRRRPARLRGGGPALAPAGFEEEEVLARPRGGAGAPRPARPDLARARVGGHRPARRLRPARSGRHDAARVREVVLHAVRDERGAPGRGGDPRAAARGRSGASPRPRRACSPASGS